MFRELVEKSRSYRRFKEDIKIKEEDLKELVDLTRFCPSSANIQPMKYMIIFDEEMNEKVFNTLA